MQDSHSIWIVLNIFSYQRLLLHTKLLYLTLHLLCVHMHLVMNSVWNNLWPIYKLALTSCENTETV